MFCYCFVIFGVWCSKLLFFVSYFCGGLFFRGRLSESCLSAFCFFWSGGSNVPCRCSLLPGSGRWVGVTVCVYSRRVRVTSSLAICRARSGALVRQRLGHGAASRASGGGRSTSCTIVRRACAVLFRKQRKSCFVCHYFFAKWARSTVGISQTWHLVHHELIVPDRLLDPESLRFPSAVRCRKHDVVNTTRSTVDAPQSRVELVTRVTNHSSKTTWSSGIRRRSFCFLFCTEMCT